MSCMKCLSECFYSKKPALPRKIPGRAPVTFNLTFHPNLHPNIWVFANLPIYSKSIHDNISFVFWKPKTFCLALFWRRYKIVCTYKHLLLKKIKFIVIPIYLHCCNTPKGCSSNSSKVSDYVNIVEITATQH